jgi:predicted O-methyltransferase YrrM
MAFRRPREFREQLSKDIELLIDKLRDAPSDYEPVDFQSAAAGICRLLAGDPKVQADPQLLALERSVRDWLARSEPSWVTAYNSDFALARCVYMLCRWLKPDTVVETGVALGVTTTFILSALNLNRRGRLYSIDLPPVGGDAGKRVGVLVPAELRSRWQLAVGSSRHILPSVLGSGNVDLFLHDSLHTYRNMRWEFNTAWPHVRPGGVVVADDVQGNRAFLELRSRNPAYWRVVRQEDKPFYFGVAVK